jgi:hypothetical protein
MIPPLDPATGNLPPGMHEATWSEIVARYGYSAHRLALLAGLKAALDALRDAGCRRACLNGSFVGAKEVPGDFDVCWGVAGVDLPGLALRARVLFDLRRGRLAQKARFGCELIPVDRVDAFGASILDLVQRDKATGVPKGIIAINLGDLP